MPRTSPAFLPLVSTSSPAHALARGSSTEERPREALRPRSLDASGSDAYSSVDGFERSVLVRSGFESRSGLPSGRTMEAYFPPVENAAAAEMALLDRVLEARRQDPTVYADAANPYRISYAVYNLRSSEIIAKIIEAAHLGVQVKAMVDARQIAPDHPWNKVDETFEDAGLLVVRSDAEVSDEARDAAHLIGIQSGHLMHLKTRIFSYRDEGGRIQKAVLSGSMNPGDAATLNDENLNLIFEPRVVAAYEEKVSDVLHHRRSENHWDPDSSINVLFTPCRTGVRPIEKLFEWIDAENEFIMISVFDLTNLVSPGDRRTLVDHLADAKARGAEVVIITDRKKSDGRDAEGNRVMMYGFYATNDMIDEMLEDAGLPVYEFVNETGEFNAMHARSAVFGLSNIKVMTDAGNWTRAGIGSGHRRGRNEESFLFIDSSRLDNNRMGRRYLGNALSILRHYQKQDTDPEPAESLIQRLMKRSTWPRVTIDPRQWLSPERLEAYRAEGQTVVLRSDDAPLNDLFGPAGLVVPTSMSRGEGAGDPTIELPFGALVKFKVFTREDEGPETLREELVEAIAIPTSDRPEFPRFPEIVGAPTLATTIATTTAPTVATTTAPTVAATGTPAPPMHIDASSTRSESPRRRP